MGAGHVLIFNLNLKTSAFYQRERRLQMWGKCRVVFSLASIVVFLTFSSWCWAGVNDTVGVGAKATALGGAFTAYADDFSAVHYNPAGLTQTKGVMGTIGLQVSDLDYEQRLKQKDFTYGNDPLSGMHTTNNNDILYVPTLGVTYSPEGARWAFGYAVYSPFGAHLWSNSHTGGNRYDGSEVYNEKIIYASPTFSYEIRDNLSVGLSIGMGYQAQGGAHRLRIPGIESHPAIAPFGLPPGTGYATSLGNIDFDMDDETTFSANIGLLWEATEKFTFGLTYRSASQAKMDGKAHLRYTPEFQGLAQLLGYALPSGENYTIKTTQTQPQSLSGGVKVDVTDGWRVMCDFVWTDWSVRQKEHWEFNGDPQLLQIAAALGSGEPTDRFVMNRSWEDTYEVRVGTEVDAADWLALRLGYHYRPCGIQEKYWDHHWPMIDLQVLSLGAGVKVCERGTLDLAYSFAWGDNWDVEDGESRNLNTAGDIIYNPYAGDDVEAKLTIHTVMATFSYRF